MTTSVLSIWDKAYDTIERIRICPGDPIILPCLQEAMTKPLQLACDHTFCEACITEWLEREPTCPMCRSKVKAPNMMYKDGSVSLLPQLF